MSGELNFAQLLAIVLACVTVIVFVLLQKTFDWTMREIIVVVVAYLLGSIPFGYLIVRFAADTDVRATGSGGTGATNVSRRAGKLAGILTLILDALKGAAAIVVARAILSQAGITDSENVWLLLRDPAWGTAVAGIAVIVGHCFPVWLSFHGGKGVATAIGVFLVLAPLAVAVVSIVFLLIVGLTRYVSLGSVISAAALPIVLFGLHLFAAPVNNFRQALMTAVVAGCLIIFMHRENIQRLVSGTESKFR